MATNDTGYPITVGPDKDGAHFTVEPGAEYEPPEPAENAPLPTDTEVPDLVTGPEASVIQTAARATPTPTQQQTPAQPASTGDDQNGDHS